MKTKTIVDFKNIHQGKRLFILASGPSLNNQDLTPLERRLVMGLNRSFKIFPGTHYQCVMDDRLFELFPDELRQARYLFTLQNRPWGIPIKLLGSHGFSFNLEEGIYSGYTIAFFALQVAIYMGFKEIFYVGLDLKNQGQKTHFFGHDFRNIHHETTEFPKMMRCFEETAQLLKQHPSIKVYNCSPDSKLKCFTNVSFEYAISL